jgi:hypothetical protein
MPLAWSRDLWPIVQQPLRFLPRGLGYGWVAHPHGRTPLYAQVLMTNLPHLRQQCL